MVPCILPMHCVGQDTSTRLALPCLMPVPHPGKRAMKGEQSRVSQPSQYQIPHPTYHWCWSKGRTFCELGGLPRFQTLLPVERLLPLIVISQLSFFQDITSVMHAKSPKTMRSKRCIVSQGFRNAHQPSFPDCAVVADSIDPDFGSQITITRNLRLLSPVPDLSFSFSTALEYEIRHIIRLLLLCSSCAVQGALCLAFPVQQLKGQCIVSNYRKKENKKKEKKQISPADTRR